jgi:Ring finger domain
MSCNNTECTGCLNSQPNQLAHMDPGGCLYTGDDNIPWESDSEASEEYDHADPRVLEMEFDAVANPEKDPLFEAPIPLGECPICYEDLKMIDITITKCGHTFHSSCMFRALEQNLDCPMCRCQLLAPQEEEEEEGSDDDSDGEDDEADEEGTENGEEEAKVSLEQLAGKLTNMGYTMADIIRYIMNVKSETNEAKYTEEYDDKLYADMTGIMDGTISLAHRDARSYAQVAAKKPESHPQSQVPQVVAV